MPFPCNPICRNTARSDDRRSWTPASVDDFLAELNALAEQAKADGHLLLYRGQADFDWCLDSTIARTAKFNLFGFKAGEVPTPRAAENIWFSYALYGAFHCKFGGVGQPSKELFDLEKSNADIDPWFEHMKHIQQYPCKDHKTLKGSHLLDWSVAPAVASWFAAREGSNDAAVHVWNVELSGNCIAQPKMRDMLDRMRDVHLQPDQPIYGRPVIFCPKQQVLMKRALAQDARYVAQQDLRWPLDVAWRNIEREQGAQLYLKLRLRSAFKTRLLEVLTERGIYLASLFPDLADGEIA